VNHRAIAVHAGSTNSTINQQRVEKAVGVRDVEGGEPVTFDTSYVSFLLDAWTDRNPAAAKIAAKPSRRELAQAAAFPAIQAADAADPTSCASAAVYGFGMRIYGDCRFRHSFGHSGGLPGYGSNVLLIPEHDIGVFAIREPHVCTGGASRQAGVSEAVRHWRTQTREQEGQRCVGAHRAGGREDVCGWIGQRRAASARSQLATRSVSGPEGPGVASIARAAW
jgi:hypothetical protein